MCMSSLLFVCVRIAVDPVKVAATNIILQMHELYYKYKSGYVHKFM